MKITKIPARNEIEKKDKWDLEKVFQNKKEIEQYIKETTELIKKFSTYQNHVMDNAKTFYNVIKNLFHKFETKFRILFTFASNGATRKQQKLF